MAQTQTKERQTGARHQTEFLWSAHQAAAYSDGDENGPEELGTLHEYGLSSIHPAAHL